MDEETLNKLNIIADRIILNESKSPLDSELLLNMLKKMITARLINKPNNGVEVLLSREEILKRVLNFYKSIDTEYYSEALDFLLQLKKNKSLEIFFGKKDGFKQYPVTSSGRYNYDYIFDNAKIYIYPRPNEKNNKIKTQNKNTDFIQNSVTIVHEIAHSFDINQTDGVLSEVITDDQIQISKSKKFKGIINKIEENKKVRNIFSETTAVTFEKLYTQYLMEMTDYPKSNISSIAIERFNTSLYNADECYDNLRIAKIKKEKGRICNDDINLLMEEYNESRETIEKRIKRIIRQNGQINEMKKYAIAGLFAPTIASHYQANGVKVLKQYIEAVKNNSIDQIFDLLGIRKNENGIDTLFINMKKQIEPYCFYPNKKITILEK